MPVQWFSTVPPILQALAATCFTWLMTVLGVGLG
jgi:hypothetical protein